MDRRMHKEDCKLRLLQQYLDIGYSADKTTFRRRLIDMAHHMDFPLVSAVLVVKHSQGEPDLLYVGNRPEDFTAAADKSIAKVDPVLSQLQRSGVPFAYDQRFYVDRGAPELWEDAAPWGFRTGICVSLTLPDNKVFLLGLDRERPLPRTDRMRTRLLADLQFLAVHSQETANRLITPVGLPSATPSLSSREREILLRAREGKSNWAIGQILGVSENTVKFHLRNAFKKLGVASKVAAVHRATTMGILRP